MKRVGSLDIDEDLTFQRKEWHFEKAGWVALAAFLLAAALGVFGSGPLSTTTSTTGEGAIRVTYARNLRWQTPQFMEIQFHTAGGFELALSDELMRSWSIQKVVPQPQEVVATGQKTIYRFHADRGGRVLIEYQARRAGLLNGTIEFQGVAPVAVRQWIFP